MPIYPLFSLDLLLGSPDSKQDHSSMSLVLLAQTEMFPPGESQPPASTLSRVTAHHHQAFSSRLTKFLILWWSLSSYFSPNELADGHVLLDNNPSVVFLKKTVLKLTAFSSSRISNCSQRSWTTKFPKYPVIWPKSQIHWHFTSHWFCEGTTGAPIRPKDDWAQATHGGAGRVYT